MANAPFPIHPEYTAISIAYKNKKLIADEVLPRVTVSKKEFRYLEQQLGEAFKVPDTKVGRRSKPNQVEFSAQERAGATEDHGLDDAIPYDDIENAPPNFDPRGRAVEQLTNLVALDREVRVANRVFSAASYPAAQRKVLAGADQFSDPASDPIKEIMDALDTMIMRGTHMVIGRAAFSTLCRHPKIVKAVLGNAGDSGIARRQDIAELFELSGVLVGEGWLDTAKKGQAPVVQRVWGKHISLLYLDELADTRRGTTYGFTAEYGTRVAGSFEDKDIGLRGGERVRVGESLSELVTADLCGFFLENVAA